MKTILVATDLTERSDRAMDRAALLAKQTGAALHVIPRLLQNPKIFVGYDAEVV